jgi:hypothetical protein
LAFCTPAANAAGSALPHTPLVDEIVNASLPPPTFLKVPAAAQFPADAHDTDNKSSSGFTLWTPAAKTAGCALAHTPLVDVMVNASRSLFAFRNNPAAVQFPADAHDTDLRVVNKVVVF